MDGGLGWQRRHERPDGADQRGPVGAGQVGASDRAGEQDVAREHVPLGRVGEMAGRVARHREHVEPHAGELEPLTPVEQHIRCPRTDDDPRRNVALRMLEDVAFGRRRMNRGAGAFREVRQGGDVVEVGVRDQDGGTPGAERGERQPDLACRSARVDQDGVRRRTLRPHDVAVRRERAEGETVDGGRHARECTDVPAARSESSHARLLPCSRGTSWRSRRRAA